MRVRFIPLTLGSLAVFSCIVLAQQPRRVDDAALRNAGKSGEEWLSYNVTPQETRYTPINQINNTNVNRLGLAWSMEVGAGGGGQEATPLFYNGTLYVITNWSIVYAVDARTGKELWRWDPEVNQATVRAKLCCGVVSRGLALYEGRIIAPTVDGRLIGLDAMTGKPAWEARVAYPQDNYTITMAPRIAKGKVIIGVSGAEFPVRGFFSAFDAKTGAFAWKFYTVPGDPSKPFENEDMKRAAATWNADSYKLGGGGGGTIWDAIAYDPDEELVYVGTGNAGPWPEEVRNTKGKDLLYVCSILAVNVDTGKLKWYFQMVPSDEWDYDSVQQLMIADVTVKGQKRKVIMQANKNGFYYVLDRVTGQFISGKPFAKVNWAKGLNEATGRPIVNADAHYSAKESVALTPGPGGAHNWPPMSFHPNTGLVYIPSQSGTSFNYAVQPDFTYKPNQINMAVVLGFPQPARRAATSDSPDVANAAAAAPTPPPPPVATKKTPPESIGPDVTGGSLVAWDPATGTEKWRAPGAGGLGGGTVAVGANLVLQVLPDGRLMAYSADKGEKLLELKTGAPNGMGPPMTYMLDGKQYVALLGGQGAVPRFPGAPANAPVQAPVPPRLLVFALDATATLPAAK
jgi:quinohemoprotein ethanol dehydrogenase